MANMQEIKCPKCGEIFQVDESGYQHIVKQIRDKEFKKELEQRLADNSRAKDAENELQILRIKNEHEAKLAQKDQEIIKLKNEAETYAQELKRQENELTARKDNEYHEQRREQEREYDQVIAKKDSELAKKEQEISELKLKLEASATEKS